MNRLFSIVSIIILAVVTVNCNKDDNSGGSNYVPIRKLNEVYLENIKSINEYLDNNYLIEKDGVITFDSITSPAYIDIPDDQKPKTIREDSRLRSDVFNNDDYTLMVFTDPKNPYAGKKYRYLKSADTIKYKIYYLLLNEGEGHQVSPLDSIFMKRKTTTLKNKEFNPNNPYIGGYYSFPTTIPEYNGSVRSPLRTNTGDRQILKFIKTATGIGESSDGLPIYDANSAGRIIAFIPSGLGMFNASDSGLAGYQPYITDITLISNKERDHDLDGIKTKYEVKEVIEKDASVTDAELETMNLTIHNYFSLDTDDDGIPNFLDIDDDGDSVSTKDELSYKDDQNKIQYYPYFAPELKTCTGTPRYLDATCFPDRKDGEWIWYTKDQK